MKRSGKIDMIQFTGTEKPSSEWRHTTNHVMRPSGHYDVTDFVFVAKRRGHAAWQQTQYH